MNPANTPPRIKTDRPYRPSRSQYVRGRTAYFPPEVVARDDSTPAFDSFSRTNGLQVTRHA